MTKKELEEKVNSQQELIDRLLLIIEKLQNPQIIIEGDKDPYNGIYGPREEWREGKWWHINDKDTTWR